MGKRVKKTTDALEILRLRYNTDSPNMQKRIKKARKESIKEQKEYDIQLSDNADYLLRVAIEDECESVSVGGLYLKLGCLNLEHGYPVIYTDVESSLGEIVKGYEQKGERMQQFLVEYKPTKAKCYIMSQDLETANKWVEKQLAMPDWKEKKIRAVVTPIMGAGKTEVKKVDVTETPHRADGKQLKQKSTKTGGTTKAKKKF